MLTDRYKLCLTVLLLISLARAEAQGQASTEGDDQVNNPVAAEPGCNRPEGTSHSTGVASDDVCLFSVDQS